MKVSAYIPNWDSPEANALRLFTQLEKECGVTILSSFHTPFASQWREAVDLFMTGNSDIFLWAMADVTPERLPEMFRRMIQMFERGDIGMYAPNIRYSSQIYNTTKLPMIDFGVYQVCGTDLLFCALTRELLKALPPLGTNIRAWGYDYLMTVVAEEIGLKVVRDYNFTFGHPEGSDYNLYDALEGFSKWLITLSENHKRGIQQLQGRQAYLCA